MISNEGMPGTNSKITQKTPRIEIVKAKRELEDFKTRFEE